MPAIDIVPNAGYLYLTCCDAGATEEVDLVLSQGRSTSARCGSGISKLAGRPGATNSVLAPSSDALCS